MARRTKIVATIGPASESIERLGELIDAGVSVARLNLAHGGADRYLELAERIRKVADQREVTVAILADLPGPKIRTTAMGDEGVLFSDHSIVEIVAGSEPTTAQRIFTDYSSVAHDLRAGDSIALGDGGVDMRVVGVVGDVVKLEVLNGGCLRGRPGLHLPSDRVTLPVPTDVDRELIESVVKPAGVDFVAVSFVRTADSLRTVRSLVGRDGPAIVAKIETPAAIKNLDEIVAESDAVMVARGDLGTECPFEDVPIYQKRIIRTCVASAVPVITATQMLESMITASTPTRAEASDVANAVNDGTDAVMLSAETAVGQNPPLVVQTMARIAERAEQVADYERFALKGGPGRHIPPLTAALTHAALHAATDAKASAILCFTRSGATARAMATLRPEALLIALSPEPTVVRQQSLTWGVVPMPLPHFDSTDEMVLQSVKAARAAGHIHPGEVVAVLAGAPGVTGSTNVLRMLTVGN